MRSLLLALPLSALLLAGCGGDDGATTSDGTAAATETTAPSEAAVVTDAASGDVCAQLADLADIDPDALPSQADIDRVTAVAETAPPEIQQALVRVAEVGQLIADTGEAGLDDPEAYAQLEAAAGSPRVTDAAGSLVAYAAEQCDIEVPLFSSFTG